MKINPLYNPKSDDPINLKFSIFQQIYPRKSEDSDDICQTDKSGIDHFHFMKK